MPKKKGGGGGMAGDTKTEYIVENVSRLWLDEGKGSTNNSSEQLTKRFECTLLL